MKTKLEIQRREDGRVLISQVPVMPDFDTINGFNNSGMMVRGEDLDISYSSGKISQLKFSMTPAYYIYIRKISDVARDILLIPSGMNLCDVIVKEIRKLNLKECIPFEYNLRGNGFELASAYIYPFIDSEIPLLSYKPIAGLIGKL